MPDVVGRVIATAARQALAPIGAVRKGRSRAWIDDHGWWLINIEFQPSGHAKGCYLNIGEQHLWVVRDHLCFESLERPLGGSTFISFDGDEDAFSAAMKPVVTTAVTAVQRRRDEHGEGIDALERLTTTSDDLNAGIAAALLGATNEARQRLTGLVHDSYRECASGYVGLSADQARERAWADVQATRDALRLPSAPRPAWSA